MNGPTVFFVANRGYALTSSRTSLIRHFLERDWKVVLATADDAESRKLCRFGAYLEPVNFDRGGMSPLADMKAYRRLRDIYRQWSPQMVHQFHAKPIILGTLAAKRGLKKSVQVVNTITGLGHAFVNKGFLSKLAGIGYRSALAKADITVFQNRDDQELFLDLGLVAAEQSRLIAGSGVDTSQFTLVERQEKDNKNLVIVMLGRLLRQKGIFEFIEVAHRIRQHWPEVRFLWAGEEDPVHPDSIRAEWLHGQKEIEYLGRLSDVVSLLNDADLLLFPSSYREGVPRVVLEASATGLPTVGFDVPGVREAVRDGQTGYLVPFKDVDALIERVTSLMKDKTLRLQMGNSAREMVEKNFDQRNILEQYIKLYRDLGLPV